MKNSQLTKSILLLVLIQSVLACNTKPDELSDFEPIVRPIAPKPMQYNQGSLFQQHSISLYEDPKPHRIGDILTIILDESTSASKKAGTKTKKEDESIMANPTMFGLAPTHNGNNLLEMNVSKESEFVGEGDSSQSNNLTGEITVTVVDILPNGNLVVQGEKWFTLNQGKEYIRIAGVVRPLDVLRNNTLPSAKLADAQITYSGEGFIADSNNQGWFGQMMNSPYWPF